MKISPSVARKFLNEVKSTIVTLQRVVKQRMTIETHNWASSTHQEFHKIVREEIFPIVNQVDARLQNFEIQFLKEAAKFVGDFKSLANEADASLAKHKALELEIERLLKAVVTYKDMQQKIEWLQAQLGDLKCKSKDTSCVSDARNPISPDKVSREAQKVPNTVSASSRTKPITVSQPSVIPKKDMNSNLNGLSSTGLDNTKTRRPQPRSNTKNDRVPSASKSSRSKNKEVNVEEHHRNLLLSKKNKHISLACNNSKIDSQDVISKFICAMCCSKHMTGNLKLLINFVWKFKGTVRFENDHVAAILSFGDL
nr:integrase, catalytic region, zinc finger, CCHC-type, peptidase aspartic, catalytic [Tanacetum cinerariifolium]